MAYIKSVVVGGVAMDYLSESLSIEDRIDERSTCFITIIDSTTIDANLKHYQKGTPIIITDSDDVTIFSGYVETSEEERYSPQGGLYHHLECIDQHYIADKLIIPKSYEDKTGKYIVEDLITNYLAAEGIVADTIQDGADFGNVVFNYISCDECINKLAAASNFWWKIDFDKKLFFVARGTVPAPINFTNMIIKKDTLKVTKSNPLYRNRQVVMGKDTTSSQTANFIGDGERAAFTVGFPVSSVPTITLNSNPQTVGIKGLDTGKDWYWSKGDAVIVQDASGTILENTDSLVIVYFGEYKFVSISTNEAAVADRISIEGGGTGYVDDFDYTPGMSDKQSSFDLAKAALQKYGAIDRTITFDTAYSGFSSGQIATFINTLHNFTGQSMLIESISIREVNGELIYSLIALEGNQMGSWASYFKKISKFDTLLVDTIDIGSEEIVIIVKAVSEDLTINESIDQTVYSCPVPADNLYPSDVLYPC